MTAAVSACFAATAEDKRMWQFCAYGPDTDAAKVSLQGSYGEGVLHIKDTGSGKLTPYGADGLVFYDTALDAQTDNFVLSATVEINSWTMTNGEDDGFGLMVCDAQGRHGQDAEFWNNSYMAAVTKVEYEWNPATKSVSNVGDHIIMRQGIAALEKTGQTAAHPKNERRAAAKQHAANYTLESSQGEKGAGTYNIIGNFTPIIKEDGKKYAPVGSAPEEELLTSIRLELCRDNTGYRIRYIENNGAVHEKLFYDPHRNALAAIDGRRIYAGFFVTGKADVTFRDMKLVVTDARSDKAAEPREAEVREPDFRVISSATANTQDYELIFRANYAGTLSVQDENGNTAAADVAVQADEETAVLCTLHLGENRYKITFAPDRESASEFLLSDFSKAVFYHTVSYRKIGDGQGDIYAAPGNPDGDGTKENPIGLLAAVSYAAPGQTIFLTGERYKMEEPLCIERGHDGTETQPITLTCAPENTKRPVLDFQERCAGIRLLANYWRLKGFDCTGSAVNEYGIQLSGSYNLLERLEIYRNGNTGLHISSQSFWEGKERWPKYNTVRNCTSYGNCDDAYEDADGFACQFTAGAGNVFDGCIAHHNADDGWDLYAKVWLKPIGPVTIRNCIAYQNGYLENGREAGDGNGFKLGGDNMPGKHTLENCLSFANKQCGFTSNSCPDVTLLDCTALDNGGYNITLYTDQENTAYTVKNTCSFRTVTSPGKRDRIKERGTQKMQDLYNEDTYYWNRLARVAANGLGKPLRVKEFYISTQFTEGVSIARAPDGRIILRGNFLQWRTSKKGGAHFP